MHAERLPWEIELAGVLQDLDTAKSANGAVFRLLLEVKRTQVCRASSQVVYIHMSGRKYMTSA